MHGNTELARMDDISNLFSPIFCLSKQHQGASEEGKRNSAVSRATELRLEGTSGGHLAQTPLKATPFFRPDFLFVQRTRRERTGMAMPS